MLVIDADAIGATIPPSVLVEAMRDAHRSGRMGPVERLMLEDRSRNAASLTWSGWDPSLGIVVKTSTIFNDNSRRGRLPNLQSVVNLCDGEDGRPLAVIHGESFTRMKTAADSALGADILARRDVDAMAILGAGGQAETQVRFLLAVRPSIRRVSVWNRSLGGAERLCRSLEGTGVSLSATRTAEEAVRGAGLVTCVTAATEPILRGAWLTEGTHVDLVGGFTPEMRESDDQVVLRGRLFADSNRFGVETCGDYATPISTGIIGADRIEGDLFALCSGRVAARRTRGEITVFKNGGGGHLDLFAARAFYDHARASPENSFVGWRV